MLGKRIRRIFAVMTLGCMLLQIPGICAFAQEYDVKITESEYEVQYPGVWTGFLCNKKTIGNKPGTEYFLTYTVEEVSSCGAQVGLIGTSERELEYPYTKGVMYYETQDNPSLGNPLFQEGYTYLIKYEITENGFLYTAARAKDDEAEYFTLNQEVYEGEELSLDYFGIWVAGDPTTMQLSHVRFYDKEGNDLGLYSKEDRLLIYQNKYTEKDKQVDHRYTLEAKDLANLAISNAKPLQTQKMFIEYTVKSSASNCIQNGVVFSNSPKEVYPHANGLLKYRLDCLLLQEGAEYLITLERLEGTFLVMVQMTKDGCTTFITLPYVYGSYDANSQYFSLWFGEGNNYSNFVLENFKMYDSNKNNLGVQSNNSALKIEHFGEILDYTGCEAVYYCMDDESYYVLYKNQTLCYAETDGTEQGTYRISDGKIKIKTKRDTSVMDYLYQHMTDDSGKRYHRLMTYKVRFVTGNSEEIATQILNATTGYAPQKPTDPVWEGYQFEGWCLADGTLFDFEHMVTESKTLYAKWSDNAGREYLATSDELVEEQKEDSYILLIGVCVVLVLGALSGSILLVKGGLEHDRTDKKKEKEGR